MRLFVLVGLFLTSSVACAMDIDIRMDDDRRWHAVALGMWSGEAFCIEPGAPLHSGRYTDYKIEEVFEERWDDKASQIDKRIRALMPRQYWPDGPLHTIVVITHPVYQDLMVVLPGKEKFKPSEDCPHSVDVPGTMFLVLGPLLLWRSWNDYSSKRKASWIRGSKPGVHRTQDS